MAWDIRSDLASVMFVVVTPGDYIILHDLQSEPKAELLKRMSSDAHRNGVG